MLSTKVFAPVMFDPPEFRITDDSPSASYWVSITLAKRPASTVRMDVDRESTSRGTMQITSLVFEPSNWNQPQYFVFEPSDSSPRGESFNIEFDIESSDPEFSKLQTFFQVLPGPATGAVPAGIGVGMLFLSVPFPAALVALFPSPLVHR